VAGVQIPGLSDDPLGRRRGSVDLPQAQMRSCLDGGALGARAAVSAQAQPNGFRRVLFGLARMAEVPVGTRSVTQVAAFVEVQPFRLRPVSDKGQGCRRIVKSMPALLGITSCRVRACLHGREHGDRARCRHLPGDVARGLSKVDRLP
jgi:hypothetical protein